jgi:hypothetical protein
MKARNLGLGFLLSIVLIGCGRDHEIQEIRLSTITPNTGITAALTPCNYGFLASSSTVKLERVTVVST